MAGFVPSFLWVLLLCFFLSLWFSQSKNHCLESKSTFQMLTFLLLLPVSLSSPCTFPSLSHWLASCACCVTYASLPLGSTPSALPWDCGPVVALWRGREKTLGLHSKEKKSLWEEGQHLAIEGLCDFIFFPMRRWGGSMIMSVWPGDRAV